MEDNKYLTPANNIQHAALRLLRHKALVKLAQDRTYLMDIEDVNEVLCVAQLPLIIPEELKAKEIDVIKVNREDEA